MSRHCGRGRRIAFRKTNFGNTYNVTSEASTQRSEEVRSMVWRGRGPSGRGLSDFDDRCGRRQRPADCDGSRAGSLVRLASSDHRRRRTGTVERRPQPRRSRPPSSCRPLRPPLPVRL